MVEITDESTKAHSLKVIMTDVAGNQTVSEIEGFYVTTNLWIRFINNKPLVIAVIIAALVLVAGGIFLATRRRKYR